MQDSGTLIGLVLIGSGFLDLIGALIYKIYMQKDNNFKGNAKIVFLALNFGALIMFSIGGLFYYHII